MYRQKAVSLGTVGGLAVHAAFVLRVIGGSTILSSVSPSSSNAASFPNCTGTISEIGDGFCYPENNNVDCGYDGGDCCECRCVASALYTCGWYSFKCLDPEVGDPVVGCDVVANIPPEVYPCVSGTRRHWVVETTADADSLAEGTLCSGGRFEVEWKGSVSVNRTLYVIAGTVLDIVGAPGAVADGGGTTQLFSVVNGVLRVSDLEMSNGIGVYGGAISATERSEVTLTRVKFRSNTADGFGGGVHLYTSFLELANTSTFIGNSATYGGAIYLGRNSTVMLNAGNGEVYRFIDNNATDGGAVYVSQTTKVAAYRSWNGSARNMYTFGFGDSEDTYPTVRDTCAKLYFINNTAQRSGGGLYVDMHSEWVWVGETIFEGNSGGYGGALFFGPFVDIRWQGITIFAHNSAREDGGAVMSTVYRAIFWTSISIDGVARFFNNTCGGNGGALALFDNTYVNWGNTTPEFSGNSAALFGGAVYLSEADSGHHFDHARFTENQAQVKIYADGGAVFAAGCGTDQAWTYGDETGFNPTIFSNCTFVGNAALERGGAIVIAIGRAHVYNTTFVGNIASVGGALRLFGTVELLNSSFYDNVSGEGGGSAISNAEVISDMFGLYFSGNRYVCADTEYVDFTEGHNMLATICQGCYRPCDGCTIEDNTSVPTCKSLFDHAQSENGTSTIERVIVDPGYWRASNQSTNLFACFNADACLGGLTDDAGYCSDGYEGPYCSVCSKGYAAILANACSKCSGGNVAVVALVLAIASLSALVITWHMVSIEKEDATRSIAVCLQKVLPLQSIKIVFVAWQIVTQFTSVAHVIYPEAYQRLIGFMALVNFDIGWMLSAGCIVDADFHDGLLVATIGPVAVIALLGITYVVAINRNRGSEGAIDSVRRKHLGAAFLLTVLIYSSVSSTVFRTFACDELDDGSVYLRADYRIECDSPRHKYFMIYAALMIIVYPVGIPLFYTIILFREHNMMVQGLHHETPRNDATSTLRKPYRPSVFYYEVVECSRRILLTGAVVFIFPDTAAQIAVAIVIAFVFVMVSEGLSPYESWWDSWVSRAGHVIVFFSLYVALLLKVDISSERPHDQNVFTGILVAAHAIMVSLVIAETCALFSLMKNNESSLRGPRRRSTQAICAPPSGADS